MKLHHTDALQYRIDKHLSVQKPSQHIHKHSQPQHNATTVQNYSCKPLPSRYICERYLLRVHQILERCAVTHIAKPLLLAPNVLESMCTKVASDAVVTESIGAV
jgi:hypothetical protein